jgi:hypothetical protein
VTEPDEVFHWRWPANQIEAVLAEAKGYRAGWSESEARINVLEEAIREANSRLKDYTDLTVEQWNENVADGGITAWMVIRQELQTLVAGNLNRALKKEDDEA